ncbi:unnamed protein product [Prunus armeniaca]|uniref:Retrovirus-related Pol polyprotein from transposon TNT 1-94-like beta-barrel domain-containing protein n=1 Tax=Prunus armeniaca TaxID=36596 RepID=A0A6J5TXM4_PRUAR|nr:unnamed protein product [Prunus armeniaca]
MCQNAFMNHEVRHRDKNHDSSFEASVVRGRSSEKRTSTNKRKSQSWPRGDSKNRKSLDIDECALCHNKGHWKKDCPKLKAKGKEKMSSEVNVAEVENGDFELALIASSSDNYSTRWILDMGCTHHMCPHSNWFFNFKALRGGVVFMGDDSPCET